MNHIHSNIKAIVILCIIILTSSFNGLSSERVKRISFFLSSGVSFPSYPDRFAISRQPAFNAGCGLEWSFSSRLSLRGNYNYYCYYLKDDYSKFLWIGDSRFELPGKGTYVGDVYYSVNDIWVDIKYRIKSFDGLSPYLIAGLGFCYIRDGSFWTTTVSGGRKIRAAWAIMPMASAGCGMSYKLYKGIRLFAELTYRRDFYKEREKNRASFPLRIGISSRH